MKNFAIWLGKKGWKCISNDGKVWVSYIDDWFPNKGTISKTIDELYDEFLKETQL